ncbi:MAG: ornithine carbamoyltransferase [Planctomycetes bacterium]|nr:ornithine carbamoyltransferase [Planctomycetota bacterium]
MSLRHFFRLADWSSQDLWSLLELCRRLKGETARRHFVPHLQGRNIGLVFDKASLRTQLSFEVGINQLGGHAVIVGKSGTLGEREPISDFAQVASRYLDGLVVRTFEEHRVESLIAHATVPVVNALTDNSHPCQAMGDVFTLLEHWGNFENRTLCYIGDSNNVARSLMHASLALGLGMRISSPRGYEFPEAEKEQARARGVRFIEDPAEAAEGVDALYTDTWISMGQENEREKRQRDFAGFQVDSRIVGLASSEVLVMHCMPAHRGEEVSAEVLDGEHSIIFDQAENRLHIQKAVMVTIMAPAAEA